MFFKTSQIKLCLCLKLLAYRKEDKVKNIFKGSYFIVYVWGQIEKILGLVWLTIHSKIDR
jgi:hypothetical protein